MFSTIDPQHTSKLMINYQKQSHYSQDQGKDAHNLCYFSVLYRGLACGERQEEKEINILLNRKRQNG